MSERQLGHYRIIESIGSGGMGEVFLAQDSRLDRQVALKILPEHMAAKPDRRARFERETKAVAALNHPNIVTIYSVEETEGVHYFTMEYIPGQSLTELIPTDGLPLREFFTHAISLCDAIAAAHRQGITHRDLKPDNVRINEEGRLKVLDFGLAKLRETQSGELAETIVDDNLATQEGKIVGSVHYMSPEQAQGKTVDHRSDIFALGILLYEMATGLRPFQGETSISVLSSILRDTPSSVTDLRRALPRHLGRIIQRCLAKDPDGRYQSARVLRDELTELRDEIVSGSRESWPGEAAALLAPPKRRLPRRLSSYLLPAALVLVLLLGLRMILDRGGPETPLAGEMSVAVVDFQNLSQPEDLTPSTILTSLVQVGLIESSPCRVVSLEYLKDLRRRLFGSAEGPIARNQALALGREGGASTLLFGDLTETGENIVLTWQLVDADQGEALGAGRISGENYANLADQAVRGILPLLSNACGTEGESLEQIRVGELTTESNEAYRLFIGAQKAMDELRSADAREQLERAVALDSTFALGLSHLAMTLGSLGEDEASQDILKRAWDLRSKLGVKDRLKLEATKANLEDRYQDSIATHEEILTRWPDDRDALQAMINYHYSRGFSEKALPLSRRAVGLYPEDRSLNTTHAYILAQLGRLDEALAGIKQHVNTFPDNPNGWDTLGDMFLKRFEPDSARVAYQRCIEISPRFWNSHLNLSLCDFMAGDLPSALGRLERLSSRTDIPPGFQELIQWWAIGLHRAAGRYAEADTMLIERAASMEPDDKRRMELLTNRAFMKILAGKLDQARSIQAERLAMAKDGHDAEAAENTGDVDLLDIWLKIKQDSLPAARVDLDSLLAKNEKLGPHNSERAIALLMEASLLLAEGHPQTSLRRIRDWRALHPVAYTDLRLIEPFLDEVAVASLRALGRPQEALDWLQLAQSRLQGWSRFHFLIAQVQEELGLGQEAIASYLEFLAQWNRADEDQPELLQARQHLEKLLEAQS